MSNRPSTPVGGLWAMPPATPAPPAAPPPATPAATPSGALSLAVSNAQIARRDFNRGFLDRHDPLESVGASLPSFAFAATYPVRRVQQPDLLDRLHAHVYTRVRDGSVAHATAEMVEFKDVKTGSHEAARRYIVIQAETVRGTRMSVFTTFLTYGDNLYLAVNSFILPPMSWWSTAFATLTAVGLLLYAWSAGGVLGLVLYALIVGFFFRGVVRDLSQGEPLSLALRKKFPKRTRYSTFNTDDMLMFFKSTLPLVLTSVQEVFEQAGIPVDVLERAIQNLNLVTNIHTGGGALNAVNSVLGGAGNQAGAAARGP